MGEGLLEEGHPLDGVGETPSLVTTLIVRAAVTNLLQAALTNLMVLLGNVGQIQELRKSPRQQEQFGGFESRKSSTGSTMPRPLR